MVYTNDTLYLYDYSCCSSICEKIESRLMLFPLIVCEISAFIIPNINAALNMCGVGKQYTFTLSAANLFSIYMIYFVMSYLINKGCLTRLSTPITIALTVCLFLGD